jgi:hypothetical protein
MKLYGNEVAIGTSMEHKNLYIDRFGDTWISIGYSAGVGGNFLRLRNLDTAQEVEVQFITTNFANCLAKTHAAMFCYTGKALIDGKIYRNLH